MRVRGHEAGNLVPSEGRINFLPSHSLVGASIGLARVGVNPWDPPPTFTRREPSGRCVVRGRRASPTRGAQSVGSRTVATQYSVCRAQRLVPPPRVHRACFYGEQARPVKTVKVQFVPAGATGSDRRLPRRKPTQSKGCGGSLSTGSPAGPRRGGEQQSRSSKDGSPLQGSMYSQAMVSTSQVQGSADPGRDATELLRQPRRARKSGCFGGKSEPCRRDRREVKNGPPGTVGLTAYPCRRQWRAILQERGRW